MTEINKKKFTTIDEYHSAYPEKIAETLEKLRRAIKSAVPEVRETISYNMPAFRFHGILVYYAVHTHHIGFYPGTKTVNDVFKEELKNYDASVGTIRFPFGKPLPLSLIKKIVTFKASENLAKAKAKRKKKK
jgi:uncharacterized protein YdhG (YjbR/CyaY superfamily)